MGSTIKAILLVTTATALLVAIGCKSEGTYREQQRTQGAEVEAMEEHGDTAIDAADETEE